VQDAVAIATEPDTHEVVGADRPDLADRADRPKAEAPLSGVKETGVKKSRHKSAHHRRRDQGRTWARADSWRARSIRYAGYGEWFGYR
jgi:hypothetical protein